MKPRIAFVDDERALLRLYQRMLGTQALDWDIEFFDDSLAAWEYLRKTPVDVVVSDVSMPGFNGLELLTKLRGSPETADVPVTMLTGLAEAELKCQALDLGATDLLSKPVQAPDLIARIRSMLRLKSVGDRLKRRNHDLEEIVQARTRQLRRSRLEIIWRLGKAAEFRDEETGEHVVRVGCCSRVLGEAMGLPAPVLENLFLAAPLHDIGKIGIPDAILLKPGRLTDCERRLIQMHCEIGERILREPSLFEICSEGELSERPSATSESDAVIELARQIALSHHERWDGLGYPFGLSGTEIPLSARIVGVADVYDALTSARPYKAALPHDEALAIIVNDRGTHFDPAVVDAFLQVESDVTGIRRSVASAQGRLETDTDSTLAALKALVGKR